jgi:hypothetical protein
VRAAAAPLPHLLLAVALAGAGCPAAAPEPPNLVLVIADDHGWPDSGFMGWR